MTFDHTSTIPALWHHQLDVVMVVLVVIPSSGGWSDPGCSRVRDLGMQIKAIDMPGLEADAICKNIIGTCRSMGVDVETPEGALEGNPPPTVTSEAS